MILLSRPAALVAALVMLGIAQLPLAADAAQVPPAQAEKIRSSLSVFLPNFSLDDIRQSPVPGLYEVTVGSRLFYVTEDGRYLVQGSLFDLEQQRDVTKPRIRQLRAEVIQGIGERDMLIYEPDEARYQVTVFTDIDCPYCRKMHAQMAEYLKRGIRFRYLLYPRAGKGSPSYDKAVSVWCAPDRQAAMDQAKRGVDMPKRTCDNPVDKHLKIGGELPIRGTPAIVLDDGEVVPGFVPPANLLALLQQHEKKE
jgi:thiol:disulfide interchange protein DsbC